MIFDDAVLVAKYPHIYQVLLDVLDSRPMLDPDGTGHMTSRRFAEFRLAATAPERCDMCVPVRLLPGVPAFHDEFAHMAYIDGANPFHHFHERVFDERFGDPDPYPDCTFRARLTACSEA